MSTAVRMAKVGEIFRGKNHLHLVIWNRFCAKSHSSGLMLVKKLIEDYDLVMPMLRPIGRKGNAYVNNVKSQFEEPVPNSICNEIPPAPTLREGYSGHCELWIQVADAINSTLVDFLRGRFNKKSNGFAALLYHNSPTLAPLGKLHVRNGFDTEILRDIGKNQLPAFRKLIWYRSSVVIVDWLSTQNGAIPTIDPVTQKGVLHELMTKIMSSINPNDYGLSSSYDSIDPSSFGVSHMSALAIDALTVVTHLYQIETHPYSYPNKEGFLKLFMHLKTSK